MAPVLGTEAEGYPSYLRSEDGNVGLCSDAAQERPTAYLHERDSYGSGPLCPPTAVQEFRF